MRLNIIKTLYLSLGLAMRMHPEEIVIWEKMDNRPLKDLVS
jgi:hypothetical protein